jgi:acetyl-CoA carboxylase carboxyltransferase component
LALRATGAISDDGIIDPRDTRDVLGMCLSVVRNRPIKGAEGYGVFRL